MADESKVNQNLEKLAPEGNLKNPQLIWDILESLGSLNKSYQLSIIDQLLYIARTKLHNPSLILSSSRKSNNKKEYLLDHLIQLMIFSEPELQEKLSELISFLGCSVGIEIRHSQNVFQVLTNNILDYRSFIAAIRVLQVLISPYKSSEPYSYFYFAGYGSGLQINPKIKNPYPFKSAISVCMWIRLEKTSPSKVCRLFVFHSFGNGGVEAYFVNNTLYYRSLGSEYNPPGVGSNGIKIYDFTTEE